MRLAQLSKERTIFQANVRDVPTTPNAKGLLVLKSAEANKKVGAGKNLVTKGMLAVRGVPLYTLTMEEGATCPATCPYLAKRTEGGKKMICYGSNMPFAHRFRHGPELEAALATDLAVLNGKHPKGFMVRLHILGDFYSVGYVDFWRASCKLYPSLRIYGYTHHRWGTDIGNRVAQMVKEYPERVCILRSDGHHKKDPLRKAITVLEGESPPADAVVCPNQTHGVACVDCGLCMNNNIDVTIAFLQH